MHDSWLSRIVKPLGLRIDPFFAELFLFFSPTPQIIEVLFHELLAFDLFLLVSLSLRISLFKISQESHLNLYIRGKCN